MEDTCCFTCHGCSCGLYASVTAEAAAADLKHGAVAEAESRSGFSPHVLAGASVSTEDATYKASDPNTSTDDNPSNGPH